MGGLKIGFEMAEELGAVEEGIAHEGDTVMGVELKGQGGRHRMRDQRGGRFVAEDAICLELGIFRRWRVVELDVFPVFELFRNRCGVLSLNSTVKGIFTLFSGGGRWLTDDETANRQSAENTAE